MPINLYAGYPNTFETDNEPIFTADLRTVIGPGTFLARFYGGSITRDIIQNTDTNAIGPCYSPDCLWVGSSPAMSTDAGNNYADDNGYAGEPYYELTTDTLHGFDAQYSLPIGNDRGNVTLGFDTHSDSFNYTEAYSSGWYWYGSGPRPIRMVDAVTPAKRPRRSSLRILGRVLPATAHRRPEHDGESAR